MLPSTDSPASDIVDPTNILSDRAYQKKFAKIWRDMTQKRRVSHQLIDEIESWLKQVRAEYGAHDD